MVVAPRRRGGSVGDNGSGSARGGGGGGSSARSAGGGEITRTPSVQILRVKNSGAALPSVDGKKRPGTVQGEASRYPYFGAPLL